VKLEDYSQISEPRRKKILAMSDSELLIEIEKGKDSILPKSIPFMKAVLEDRKNTKQEELIKFDQDHKEATLSVATRANRISIFAIIISLVAITISLLKG
jgi:hypothetical protein